MLPTMEWKVHGERTVYESSWLRFGLIDVELPTGRRFDHEVVRVPWPAAGVVVHDPDRGVLLLWRHRMIPGSRGWEIPAGRVEAGETPEQGAAREVLEETGWRPGPLRFLVAYHPSSGMLDHSYHLFYASSAVREGDPTDWYEADRVEWLTVDEVRAQIRAGHVVDGLSLTALTYCLSVGPIGVG